jgi:hypothetical protein
MVVAKTESKRTKLILAVVLTIVTLSTLAPATSQAAICKIKTESVGTVIGKGSDREAALEDARVQCFDRNVNEFVSHNQLNPDEETRLSIIDECVNYDHCGT